MEVDVFRAGGVLKDRQNRRHGSTEVSGVECHCHVNCIARANTALIGILNCRAVVRVVELWGFSELLRIGSSGDDTSCFNYQQQEEEIWKYQCFRHGLGGTKEKRERRGFVRERGVHLALNPR